MPFSALSVIVPANYVFFADCCLLWGVMKKRRCHILKLTVKKMLWNTCKAALLMKQRQPCFTSVLWSFWALQSEVCRPAGTLRLDGVACSKQHRCWVSPLRAFFIWGFLQGLCCQVVTRGNKAEVVNLVLSIQQILWSAELLLVRGVRRPCSGLSHVNPGHCLQQIAVLLDFSHRWQS